MDGNQFAFVKDKNIMNCILNANENIENTIEKRKKKRGTLIKLDIEKADEYTDWDFSDYVMAH